MASGRVRMFFSSIFSSDDREGLSRRDVLAGLGLAGLIAAAPTLLSSTPAEAKNLNAPAGEPDVPSNAKATEDRAVEAHDADAPDATDLSARRRWRRRYWRRRYWRRRHWRRRYFRRRRYWRRRYWRRRRYW